MASSRKRIKTKPISFTSETDSFFSKHFDVFFTSIVTCAGFLYALLDPQYRTGIYNDDAVYVITARDFWNTTTLHPLLEIKPDYPLPGIPLLLAPIAHLSQWGWVSVIVSIGSVFLLGRLMRKWFSPEKTLAILALFAFNPLIVRFSGIVMPVPYYALATMGAFYLMDSALRKPSFLNALGLGFVVGWGSLVRPEGALLLISIAGVLLTFRQGRKVFWRMMIPVTGWAVFVGVWFWFRWGGRTEYGNDVAALSSFWRHHLWSAFPFSLKWFQSFLYTTWSSLRGFSIDVFLYFSVITCAFLLVGAFLGFYRLLMRQDIERPVLISMGVLFVSFFGVHVFWHVADPRYFVFLIPFLVIFIVGGTRLGILGKIALLVLLLSYGYENGHAIHQAYWEPNPVNAPPWKSLEWLKRNTSTSTKVISNIAATVDLYAGRPASVILNATNVDMLQYLLADRRLDYIVLRGGTATDPAVPSAENVNAVWDRYRRWVHNYPDRFHRVFYDAAEETGIYYAAPDPKFIEAYKKFILAARHAEAQQYELAFSEVNASLALDPTLGCASNLLGALYFMANDMSSAERVFLKTIDLLPDSPNALINLASVYKKSGKMAQAVEFLNRGREINAANGDESEFKVKLQDLEKKWERGETIFFIDFPHPSFYADLSKKGGAV